MMGNTCTPMADSCQCMAKQIQYWKVISLQLKYINQKNKNKHADTDTDTHTHTHTHTQQRKNKYPQILNSKKKKGGAEIQ